MDTTENEMNGAVARQIRERLSMSQAAFWRPVGVQQSVACRYELGGEIPLPIRILLVTTYVAGLSLDTATPEGLAELRKLADIQSNFREARTSAAAARADLEKAGKRIEQARDSLRKI